VTSPVSASEFAAIQIRKSILDGTLEPGARIAQHALASEFGVSHVPLREAIQRLEAEGFLAVHPRRGAFVMPLSVEDASEIFELRATLEVKALRASMAALTSEQLQIAREICAAGDGVTDVVSYGELNVQFHRALCREAGFNGPLYQCSIYGNKKAGEKLKAMLAMGSSEPWPAALKAMTGEDKMDATAIIDYFAPLKTWLDEQNAAATPSKPS